MSAVVECSSCQGRLRVSDEHVGKALKCPRCGQVVKTSRPAAAPIPRTAPVPPAGSAARVAPAGAGAAPGAISVTCPGCKKKMQAKAALAGKTVKCPGCGKGLVIPGAAAEEEWLDVNEAVEPPPTTQPVAAVGQAGGAPPAGGWGQEVLEDQEVPAEMREDIRAEMTRNEHVVWATRPRQDILMHKARMFQLIGGGASSLVVIGGVAGAAYSAVQGFWLGVGIGLFFALVFAIVDYFALTAPATTRRTAATRPCYAMTNRRLLIHRGAGRRLGISGGSAELISDSSHPQRVVSWTGLELAALTREEIKKFEGAGDLCFGRTVMEEPGGAHMEALDDVRGVERRLREKLLHPVIDRLLRGEKVSGEKRDGGKKGGGEDEGVVETDGNIKEYVGSRSGKRRGIAYDPGQIDPELREKVEEELTEGEKILWIGEPEGKTKGRGLLGSMVGSATRHEPSYTLYALTSRRVLLYLKKGPPLSYYTPTVAHAGLEEDKRIDRGGSIIFKKVKKTITKRDKKGNTSTEVEMHYFGILRIANYETVAQLLYDTLIAPCREIPDVDD